MKKFAQKFLTAALVCVGVAAIAAPVRTIGKVASIDAANKSIVVTTKEGDQTVKVDDATKFTTTKNLTQADIKDGDLIQVNGTVGEGSVEAKNAMILMEGKTRSSERFVLGTAKVADGKLSVDVDGTVFEVKVGEKFPVTKIDAGTFEAIQEGSFAVCTMGEEGVAKSISYRDATGPAKKPAKKKAAEGEGEGAAE